MAGISSNRLKDKKEKILSLWEERSLKEVASAGTAASLALRNSLPMYLDHLSDALATNLRMDFKSVFARDKEAIRIGKLHGAARAGNKNYQLTEVIAEYHILREVLFQVLENDGPLAETQRDIILNSIEQAVNDAAVEFSEIHNDIQQKFISTLTHDLKTPITASKMSAELILRRKDVPEPVLNSASRIIASSNRLTAMINDLLDASRLRAGEELSVHLSECNLQGVVTEVLTEMALIHGDRFVLRAEGQFVGSWDNNGLRRAVENLVGNAVKYGSEKTPITVYLKHRRNSIEIVIHNHGNPIPEAEVPQLFGHFQRSKSAEEGVQTGWGLGLTLVKGVVDAHNGSVRVESSEGHGTSFILDIPFFQESIETRNEAAALAP